MKLINTIQYYIIIFFISLSSIAQTIDSKGREYLKNQNAVISGRIESIFDNTPPGYQSIERKDAFYMVDGITHYPKPHDESIKEFFFNRYKKSLKSIKETKLRSGAKVWNIYNMAYVVKTPEITLAFDLVLLPDCMIKEGEIEAHKLILKEIIDMCDILFVSHNHEDHKDNYVAHEFLKQNKSVIAQKDIFKDENFYDKITHLKSDGKARKYVVPGVDEKLILRIYPGHQAVSSDKAIDNNFYVITLPNNIILAHSGDQSWNDDFKWIDTIRKDENIDLLMVNTWTADPVRLTKGLNPKIILPGHVNEMDHGITGRVPFWKSYRYWDEFKEKTIHLFWGEPYIYNKK